VIRDTTKPVTFHVTEFPEEIIIETDTLTLLCQKSPLRLTFYNQEGEKLLEEPQIGGLGFFNQGRIARFQLEPATRFYGTGARGLALDLHGFSFGCNNTQVYGYTQAQPEMNINVPVLMTNQGFAIYFENTYPGWFDLGESNPEIFSYLTSGGELSFFIMAGSTIPEQIEDFTWLTGRQPLPPRWAFGYIQSKFGYRNETEARELVQTMRSKKIPCDAIILDLYWFDHMGDLTWYHQNFPQPFQMMADFLTEGIKTVVITEPYITELSLNFSEGVAGGYFTKDQLGNTYLLENWWSDGSHAALLDISDPDAQTWWWNKHPVFFGNELAGIWTDLGEPERHPQDMHHYLGTAAKVHNIYNLLWAQTIFEGYQQLRPNERLFNLTRSGYAGLQRYGALTWSGDVAIAFSALAAQIPMILNMGLSGLAYHHSDIGGFTGGQVTPELFTRWMQFGTFSPIMRAHGHDSQPQEPWAYGAEAETIIKSFIELRYRLLPYNYTLAFQAYQTGMPLLRPLFFIDPTDEQLGNEQMTYLWGESILVAPIMISGSASRSVYLPSGEWIDFWTDTVYPGNQSVVVSSPLERMPLFIRSGSIIPMQPVMNYTDEYALDTLYLHVYPSEKGESRYSLYEDDGISLDYQSGNFAMIEFKLNPSLLLGIPTLSLTIGPSQGEFSGKGAHRIYLSVIHRVGSEPDQVLINDNILSEAGGMASLRSSNQGYFWDSGDQQLWIQFGTSTDSSYQVQIENIIYTNVPSLTPKNKVLFLYPNYPNPFNTYTVIRFSLNRTSQVILSLFDIQGRQVDLLLCGQMRAGEHEIRLEAEHLPSGLYFYRLEAQGEIVTRKLLLIR
jgi:alpha-glucosidase (family GH31 glycosyl hydrolase)